jgi:DNA (cytosine-5)-methyltransferase 1
MVERQRASDDDGLCLGLDAANLAEAFSAGNAVVPQIAEWIARKLMSAD